MKNKDMAIQLFELLGKIPPPDNNDLNDINRGEMGILAFLWLKENGTASGKLSEHLNVSTARVATALKGLEKKEFVARTINESDKRQVKVYITQKGIIFVKEKKEKIINELTILLEYLGKEDSNSFIKIIKKIIELKEGEKNVQNNKKYQ